MTLRQVIDQLDAARDQLRAAARLERQGWPLQAQEQLAKFFHDEDMMPMPNRTHLLEEFARRVRPNKPTAPARTTGVGLGVAAAVQQPSPKPAVRSWNPPGLMADEDRVYAPQAGVALVRHRSHRASERAR